MEQKIEQKQKGEEQIREEATTKYEQGVSKRVVSLTKAQYEKITEKPFSVVLSTTGDKTLSLLGLVGVSLKSLTYNHEGKTTIAIYNESVFSMVGKITKIDFSSVVDKHKGDYGFLAVVNADLREEIKALSTENLISYLKA